MIVRLTWRNIWRNRRRTMITMGSVCFAVMLAILMQSFQKGVFGHLVKNVVSFYYGYVQVHRTGYWNEQLLENTMDMNEPALEKIQADPAIQSCAPRIESFVLASAGNLTKGCMLVGTDPDKENKLTGLQKKLVSGTYLQSGKPVALLAEGLAKRLRLHLNDTVILLGQGYQGTLSAGKYRIGGLLHFGSPELNNSLLFLPLQQGQEFLNAGSMITSMAISLQDPGDMIQVQTRLASALGPEYEVMNWKELMPDISNHIRADTSSFYVFTGILYLIIAFGLFGTLMMMTTERKYEFGLLVSIGMKKILLGWMLLIESLFITFIGLLAGIALSLPLVIYFRDHPPRLTGEMAGVYEAFGFEPLFPTVLDYSVFFTQSMIIVCIALVIGTYPFWHIIRLNPLKAMKK